MVYARCSAECQGTQAHLDPRGAQPRKAVGYDQRSGQQLPVMKQQPGVHWGERRVQNRWPGTVSGSSALFLLV